MKLKVTDSNDFSIKEVEAYSALYEKLIKQYRPRGFSKSECFSIANLKKAINSLPEVKRKHICAYLTQSETYDKSILADTFFTLRTVNYRALYDYELMKLLQRATDNELFKPSVVLSYIKLYDKFSSSYYDETVPKDFSISKIISIIDTFLPPMSYILLLNIGLITGKSITEKEISKELNLSSDTVKAVLDSLLKLLKKKYFAI